MAGRDPTKLADAANAAFATGETEMTPESAGVKIVLPFGVPAFIFAVASLTTCYVAMFVSAVFGVSDLGLNPHLQAVLMWALALMAVYALWRDRRHHGNNLPVALAGIAAAILVGILYVRYDSNVEIIAYILLLVATVLNQNAFLSFLNGRVRRQATEIAAMNQVLARRVEHQDHEIGRLERLKQFLSPQVAELVVSEGKDKLLETHRRYVACLFCDIRDFTAISERIEPEEVIAILQEFHERIGGLVTRHHGTIGYRAGDGLMAFFNDPIPCEEPVLDAVRLALDIRAAFEAMRRPWTKSGHPVGVGIGIASGYATLGVVGFRERADYTAIGGAVNIAARLCDRAAGSEILINERAYADVQDQVRAEQCGAFELKGVRDPVGAYRILGLREQADQPARP